MVEDARFEDGGEAPLALRAVAADDLEVISTLCQDAVFPISEMTYQRDTRQFALLLNRFRWEDQNAAERRNRPYERVQSLLVFHDVLTAQTAGLDLSEKEMVLSLLSINFDEQNDCGGRVELVLSGDGGVALQVDCLEVTLKDVTRPYLAPSRKLPNHPG
ncbi:hypothetical protein ACMU_08415 [Actibacterium mucosum KCTC 23349]|uniref:DUF2948 family protein n=1 Tax=Actibacterium mucosum KCTC 23349 TaxID=1454373 RepID=A0A037ZLT3_9RHOB|nr:DUF2948 family protein [Actibacterium mucosum]KAJ55791.1 hypothetical protein ACMU_08415 [Actibacterium mucosum KCTC 23349]